jgi:hypothetical protein
MAETETRAWEVAETHIRARAGEILIQDRAEEEMGVEGVVWGQTSPATWIPGRCGI